MKTLMIGLAGVGTFLIGLLAASVGRSPQPVASARTVERPQAAPKAPPAPPPAPAVDESASMRAEIDSLRRQIAELEGLKKLQDAKKAEERDPGTRGYAGMKLMEDALREKLALTADQELAMREAILKLLKASNEVWQRRDLTSDQKQAEVDRLRETLEPDFQGILNASQYAALTAARQEKKAKARENGIGAESAGYRQFLGLDAEQGKQLEAIVRSYYDRNPGAPTRYQWMHDARAREEIASILRTQEQLQRFEQNMKGLDAAKK